MARGPLGRGLVPAPRVIWYQDMADFAAGISDGRAVRQLARAIGGKGAFRRFKDELHEEYPDLLPDWYALRDTRAKRRAVSGCTTTRSSTMTLRPASSPRIPIRNCRDVIWDRRQVSPRPDHDAVRSSYPALMLLGRVSAGHPPQCFA